MLGKLSTSAATFPAVVWIFRQVHTLHLWPVRSTPGTVSMYHYSWLDKCVLNSSLLCSKHGGQREQDKSPLLTHWAGKVCQAVGTAQVRCASAWACRLEETAASLPVPQLMDINNPWTCE